MNVETTLCKKIPLAKEYIANGIFMFLIKLLLHQHEVVVGYYYLCDHRT